MGPSPCRVSPSGEGRERFRPGAAPDTYCLHGAHSAPDHGLCPILSQTGVLASVSGQQNRGRASWSRKPGQGRRSCTAYGESTNQAVGMKGSRPICRRSHGGQRVWLCVGCAPRRPAPSPVPSWGAGGCWSTMSRAAPRLRRTTQGLEAQALSSCCATLGRGLCPGLGASGWKEGSMRWRHLALW